MFRSLYAKLVATIFLLLSLVGLFMIIVVLYATDMYQQEVRQKLNQDLAYNLVKENLFINKGVIDKGVLKHVFHQLMVINPSIELYLLDQEGTILSYSAAPGKVKKNSVTLEPIRTWLQGERNFPLQGDDPRNITGKKVFSAARIPAKGPLEGYLYIILGGEEFDSISQKIQGSFILTLSSWIIGTGLLFALVAGLVLFGMITGRLKRLATVMDNFKEGNTLGELTFLESKKKLLGSDEIDNLGKTFKTMAERIAGHIEQLHASDKYRRELVANVSHDLRTPLATLTAYLETMQLKEEQLSPQERSHYIKVARKHCERLSSLVDDLFELASLEAKETPLHKEPFNIAELVQDVVQNFELPATEQGIDLTSNIGQNLSFVVGDIGLIERVLENLIINALRHTPQNGTISVMLRPLQSRIQIQVMDTGCGIPKESLPHIFKRFYRSAGHEQLSGSFSGLGLAIAKRIIDLHESNIEVESEINSGTRFAFSLATHEIS